MPMIGECGHTRPVMVSSCINMTDSTGEGNRAPIAPAMPQYAEMAFLRSDWSRISPIKVPIAPPTLPIAASGPTEAPQASEIMETRKTRGDCLGSTCKSLTCKCITAGGRLSKNNNNKSWKRYPILDDFDGMGSSDHTYLE